MLFDYVLRTSQLNSSITGPEIYWSICSLNFRNSNKIPSIKFMDHNGTFIVILTGKAENYDDFLSKGCRSLNHCSALPAFSLKTGNQFNSFRAKYDDVKNVKPIAGNV